MYTTDATITDVIVSQNKVWIQLSYDGKCFTGHHEFDLKYVKDFNNYMSLMEFTNVDNVNELIGKSVRVIDTEEINNSLVAIGSILKNKFITLNLDMFPTSEKRIYRRYRKINKSNR